MISISKLGDTYGVMTMVALPMKPQMHPYKQDLQSMCLDIVQEPYTACATELCTHSKVGGSMRKLMFFPLLGRLTTTGALGIVHYSTISTNILRALPCCNQAILDFWNSSYMSRL